LNGQKIKIFDLDFNVKYVDNHSFGDLAMGRCDTKTQQINIIGEMKEETKLSCILHECIHIITEKTGLNLEENTVLCLEAGIFGLIKNNPFFVNKITNLE